MKADKSFDERTADKFDRLSSAEQRVVRYFQANPEQVLIKSAMALAKETQTSDATIVRTSRRLGFAGLAELRACVASDLKANLSPADRLEKTLGEFSGDLQRAFERTLEVQLESLAAIRSSENADAFSDAIKLICNATNICIFGLGPTSAIAAYFSIQLNRFGRSSRTISNSGLLFADDLQSLRSTDLVIMFAYGRVYTEISTLVEVTAARGLRSILVTDSLESTLGRQVTRVLNVPRGRSGDFSLHTATVAMIELLLVGLATREPETTLASLDQLNKVRARLARKSRAEERRSAK